MEEQVNEPARFAQLLVNVAKDHRSDIGLTAVPGLPHSGGKIGDKIKQGLLLGHRNHVLRRERRIVGRKHQRAKVRVPATIIQRNNKQLNKTNRTNKETKQTKKQTKKQTTNRLLETNMCVGVGLGVCVCQGGFGVCV